MYNRQYVLFDVSCFMHQICIDTETPDERQACMSADRLGHRARHEINPQAPQHAVHSKITKFHSALASLQFHTCSTCVERFSNLNVVLASDGMTECRRCIATRTSTFPRYTHLPTT